MIKTFIFDLGKVLIPFDHEKGLRILEQQCSFSRDDIRSKIYASEELNLYQIGKISSEEFFTAVKAILNLQMDFQEFARIWNHSFIFTPIIDDSIIKKLSQKFRMLILSDTNELHFDFIRQNFPVLQYFDDFVLSYKVGFQKNSEEVFRIVVEMAECASEECFFTDDVLVNVEMAKKVGINAVQFISQEKFLEDIREIIVF